ncbi:MAG: hypothetical protein JOZ82_01415 [Marmoricola sp.]|nr:hypothetical protein [Marmoricola sp.]
MFIQVIQGRCRDAGPLREVLDEWTDTLAPGATGWLGGTYGLTDDGQFVAVVRFESRAAAEKNSTRPEQGTWWSRVESMFDGPITFHDCDDVTLLLGGGSDEAGFVQVIQGRLTDPERFRTFISQPMDALAEARPEIMGGTIAISEDGTFTETVAFRTEEEAREAEQQDMPGDLRSEFEEEMSQVEDLTYLDLHHPWFSSAKAG